MEYVIAALLILASAFGAIILNLVASELYDCAPLLARWLIDRAITQIPESQRQRCREEWYADNDRWGGGKLGKLKHAFGCLLSARAVGRILPDAKHLIDQHVETEMLNERKALARRWYIEQSAKNLDYSIRDSWHRSLHDLVYTINEMRKLIELSRENFDHRSEYNELLRERLRSLSPQFSDRFKSDADAVDVLINWLARTTIETDLKSCDD